MEAALYVAGYLATNPDVDLVISFGSAGSAKLDHAHVYQVSSVAYRDIDASPFGFPKGVTPFPGLPPVIDLGIAVTGLEQASISTGANVISGEAYRSL